MKYIPVLMVLAFALSLCNLTGKKSGLSSSNTATGGETVDKPQPTAAQTQALAGGPTVNWEQQGITWTLPKGWNKITVENLQFNYGAPGNGAFLIGSISPMAEDFPMEVSLKAFYEQAATRKKIGEVDEFHYLELDGVKGVEFREANPEHPDGIRRLQWMAYRKHAGQKQLVNLILSSSGKNFPAHEDELYGILYSTKLDH
jgi:hypothetical protein